SSFDSIGPFATNVGDIARVLEVISGWDQKDSTSAKISNSSYLEYDPGIKSFKIGIPEEYFGNGLDEEINNKIQNIILNLKEIGFKITEVSLPLSEYTIAAYYILAT